MGGYLQNYGIEEEHRGRIVKRILIALGVVLGTLLVGYLTYHNYPEKHVVNGFLDHINSGRFEAAYRQWGCSAEHPCPNYSFQRFLRDWGPESKATSPWTISSVDSCTAFLTVNVQAQGAELQSLAVQRNDHSLGYAPDPECQERKWHWAQFFDRVFHRSS